jgi:hypothetical protein
MRNRAASASTCARPRLYSIDPEHPNSIMLSMLLERFRADGNEKALALQKISPVAWQHIHFLGH